MVDCVRCRHKHPRQSVIRLDPRSLKLSRWMPPNGHKAALRRHGSQQNDLSVQAKPQYCRHLFTGTDPIDQIAKDMQVIHRAPPRGRFVAQATSRQPVPVLKGTSVAVAVPQDLWALPNEVLRRREDFLLTFVPSSLPNLDHLHKH